MTSIPFVDLKAQYLSIKSEIDAAIQNVLDTSNFIMGENVKKFEQEFAATAAEFAEIQHFGKLGIRTLLLLCI